MCREQHGALQQHTEPPQRHTRNGQGQNVRAQHNTAGAAFADLAAQTLAWQQDDGAASQSPSNPDASQVLRFDPTLGPDGGFYFVSWDSRQNGADQSHGGQAAEPALQVEHRQQLQWEQQHSQAAMPVYADRQQSELQLHQAKPIPATGDTDTLHAATATASQIAQAPAQMDMRCSPGDAAEASLSQCQAASDPEEGQEGRTSAAAPSAVLTASLAGPAAPLTGGTAAVPFPIQGGGEAGVLLRAAAAAAVGCSHELVMAAAGRCDTEQARYDLLARQTSSNMPVACTDLIVYGYRPIRQFVQRRLDINSIQSTRRRPIQLVYG